MCVGVYDPVCISHLVLAGNCESLSSFRDDFRNTVRDATNAICGTCLTWTTVEFRYACWGVDQGDEDSPTFSCLDQNTTRSTNAGDGPFAAEGSELSELPVIVE